MTKSHHPPGAPSDNGAEQECAKELLCSVDHNSPRSAIRITVARGVSVPCIDSLSYAFCMWIFTVLVEMPSARPISALLLAAILATSRSRGLKLFT